MGAAQVSNIRFQVEGSKRVVLADVAASNSYATGGDSLALTSLGISRVDEAWVDAVNSTETGEQVVVVLTDVTAPKVKVNDGGAEAANASDQSAVVRRVRLVGN